MSRNSLESNRMAIALVLAAFGAFAVLPVAAGHRDGHTKGGSKPGGDTTGCQLDFDVAFADAATDGVVSDLLGLYQHMIDKVTAATGSGPGFRLDTNGSQKLEGAGGTRELCIDLDEDGVIATAGECSGVDLRFDKTVPNDDGSFGLDLCSLTSVGDSGTVGLEISFLNDTGDRRMLSYVTQCWDRDGNLDPASASEKVTVTRTSVSVDGVGADEWTVVGNTACLRDGDLFFGPSLGDVTAPFEFTLTAQ